MEAAVWAEKLRDGYFDQHPHYKDRPTLLPGFLGEVIDGMERREKALEIGVGYGRVAAEVAKLFETVDGCDVVFDSHCHPLPRGIAWSRVTGNGSLPYYPDTFDLVYSYNVMHHVPWGVFCEYMRESLRVVRPGGVVAHYVFVGKHEHAEVSQHDTSYYWSGTELATLAEQITDAPAEIRCVRNLGHKDLAWVVMRCPVKP